MKKTEDSFGANRFSASNSPSASAKCCPALQRVYCVATFWRLQLTQRLRHAARYAAPNNRRNEPERREASAGQRSP